MVKDNSKLFILVLLGMLTAFGPFVTDMYLPSLPSMGEYFSTSSSVRTDYQYDRTGRRTDILRPFE